MHWLNLLGISVGLAMDALAVSLAAGLTLAAVTPRHVFRLAFHFGLFQFMMPVLGWAAGREAASRFQEYDHWIAFGLLAFVGGKMLVDACGQRDPGDKADPSRGLMLVTLSVATSVDALAAGLSMAFLQVSIWIPAVVIGIVACTLSAVGVCFGSRVGSHWGRRADLTGGCVLLLIGTKILMAHHLG